MPRQDYQILVVDRIQCHSDIRRDLDNGGEVEDPAEEADPARKETNNPTPLSAGGQGRPVVHTAS